MAKSAALYLLPQPALTHPTALGHCPPLGLRHGHCCNCLLEWRCHPLGFPTTLSLPALRPLSPDSSNPAFTSCCSPAVFLPHLTFRPVSTITLHFYPVGSGSQAHWLMPRPLPSPLLLPSRVPLIVPSQCMGSSCADCGAARSPALSLLSCFPHHLMAALSDLHHFHQALPLASCLTPGP